MTETIKTKIVQFLEESRKKSFSMEESGLNNDKRDFVPFCML